MVIRKNVDVNLLDQFILYKGLPFQFAGGFRHQTSDTIFIITPEFLKHELYALGSRDVGIPSEYHCNYSSCFGCTDVKQEKFAKLCKDHSKFFKEKLTGKFEYTLQPTIFSSQERLKMLNEQLNQHAELFTQLTDIPVEVDNPIRKDRSEVDECWLVCLRDDGYKYHERGFNWEKHYEKELKTNSECESGNLAINIFNISSIAEYGDLDGYRNRPKEIF